MKKLIFAIVLFSVTWAANAVEVILVSHNQTSGSGTISTLITDGSHIQGFAASTAVWDWDGTTLTSTGLYSATSSLGSIIFTPTILNDSIVDLSINPGTASATATSYTCNEGTFLAAVGANGCGGYTLGANFIDDSTTVWSGLTATQTIGGDDVSTAGPRLISAYDFDTVSVTGTGLNLGDEVAIGNGIALGVPSGELMTFRVIEITPSVTITIGGGNLQECSEVNGATVNFTADISHPPGDAVTSIEWFLDAASIGFGENLTAHVPLGAHTIDVLVTTVLGKTTAASESIDVEDTTAPSIATSFSDAKSNPITSVDGKGVNRIRVNYDVTDVCDPDPAVSAVSGVDVDNGELVKINAKKGAVKISDAENLLLFVMATDASGNVAEQKEVLQFLTSGSDDNQDSNSDRGSDDD